MSKHPSDEFQGAIIDSKSCLVQKQSQTIADSLLEMMSHFFWTSGASGPKLAYSGGNGLHDNPKFVASALNKC